MSIEPRPSTPMAVRSRFGCKHSSASNAMADSATRSVAKPPVSVPFSFNPAATEFTPSSMPSGPSRPSAAMPPQASPKWKPSNKIKHESSTTTSRSNKIRKESTPPQLKEEQPVPSEPSASPETLVEEARKLLAAMVNTGRANGKLEEVLAGTQPKAKEVVTLCRYAGILEKPQGASEESR